MDKLSEILSKSKKEKCLPLYVLLVVSLVVFICSLVIHFSKVKHDEADKEETRKMTNSVNSNNIILLMSLVSLCYLMYQLLMKNEMK